MKFSAGLRSLFVCFLAFFLRRQTLLSFLALHSLVHPPFSLTITKSILQCAASFSLAIVSKALLFVECLLLLCRVCNEAAALHAGGSKHAS